LSYDQQDFLQDGGVLKGFYPQNGCIRDLPTRWRQCRVYESFTHKMAEWEICLQNGGVSGSFTHKMAVFLKVLPTRWRRGSFAYKMAAMPRF